MLWVFFNKRFEKKTAPLSKLKQPCLFFVSFLSILQGESIVKAISYHNNQCQAIFVGYHRSFLEGMIEGFHLAPGHNGTPYLETCKISNSRHVTVPPRRKNRGSVDALRLFSSRL